jgi:hypothetical protein
MAQQRRKSKRKDPKARLEQELNAALHEWCQAREGVSCFPLLIGPPSISDTLVNKVFDDLRAQFPDGNASLDVIVQSGGGDIDAAYNMAQLLRRYGLQHLEFIVPRWAKSAATMLVCAGDRILMSPIAELGPLDPQITEMNPLEGRLEQFSPLHIGSAIDLIREEYSKGNEKLAEGLLKRLQFPITLGSYRSMVNIGKEYLTKLLSTRMLKGKPAAVEKIADKLTRGYVDHGYCIDLEEARGLGLLAEELSAQHLDIAWRIFRIAEERRKMETEERAERIKDELKDLPPEILERLPDIINSANRAGGRRAKP